MSTERKRKVSLFNVLDDTSVSAKLGKANNGSLAGKPPVVSPAINRWDGRPFSQRYFEILEKRKTLPVWQQKEEFLHMLKANQTLILVRETGSGKTTQISSYMANFPCQNNELGKSQDQLGTTASKTSISNFKQAKILADSGEIK